MQGFDFFLIGLIVILVFTCVLLAAVFISLARGSCDHRRELLLPGDPKHPGYDGPVLRCYKCGDCRAEEYEMKDVV